MHTLDRVERKAYNLLFVLVALLGGRRSELERTLQILSPHYFLSQIIRRPDVNIFRQQQRIVRLIVAPITYQYHPILLQSVITRCFLNFKS